MEVGMNGIPCCRRVVLGVVARLKNRELVMAGVVGGDCRDKMTDRLPRSYR